MKRLIDELLLLLAVVMVLLFAILELMRNGG